METQWRQTFILSNKGREEKAEICKTIDIPANEEEEIKTNLPPILYIYTYEREEKKEGKEKVELFNTFPTGRIEDRISGTRGEGKGAINKKKGCLRREKSVSYASLAIRVEWTDGRRGGGYEEKGQLREGSWKHRNRVYRAD